MDVAGYTQLFQRTLGGDQVALETVSRGLADLIRELSLMLAFPSSPYEESIARSIDEQCQRAEQLESEKLHVAVLCRLVAAGVMGLVRQNSSDPRILGFLGEKVLLLEDDDAVIQGLRGYGIRPESGQIPPTLLRYRQQVSDLVGWLSGESGKLPHLYFQEED